MYCPKCGSTVPPNATYCANCGIRLPTAEPAPPQTTSQPATTPGQVGSRSPLLAAFLNLFFGLGYLYLGKSKVLGVPTIVFVVLALVVFIVVGALTFGLVSLLLAILLAIDGYEKGSGQKGFVNAE